MRKIAMAFASLLMTTMLLGCEANEKPNIRLEPPANPRVTTPTTTDFAGFLITAIKTQTLENNRPAAIDGLLFTDTRDPTAFDELFTAE